MNKSNLNNLVTSSCVKLIKSETIVNSLRFLPGLVIGIFFLINVIIPIKSEAFYGQNQNNFNNPVKLLPSDGTANQNFGQEVAVSGNTAAVASQGAVYVFVKNESNWEQQAKIVGSDTNFANKVAIEGDTLAIAAPYDYVHPNQSQGRVYLYKRTGNTWLLEDSITPLDGKAGQRFGSSVEIDNNTLVVGSSTDYTVGSFAHGSAYVFTRDTGQWTEQQKLIASDRGANDGFGYDVDIQDDTVVVTSWLDDVESKADQGSAYIFTRNGETWTERQKLTASNGSQRDNFGISGKIDGELLLIGSSNHDSGGVSNSGGAYIFSKNNEGVWNQESVLTAPVLSIGALFGRAVDLDGDTAVISGTYVDDNNIRQGCFYIFKRIANSGWLASEKIIPFDGQRNDEFGTSVAINNRNIFVGARSARIGSNVNQGSVYAYVKPNVAPNLQNGSDSGTSNTDNITNNRNPSFDIAGVTIGATVELLRNNQVIASGIATDSIITLTDLNPPANGTFDYSSQEIIDNESSTLSTIQITFDTTSPIAEIDRMPPQRDYTNESFVQFRVSFSESVPHFGINYTTFEGSTADLSSSNIIIDQYISNVFRVAVTKIGSDGTIVLNLLDSLTDVAGNPNTVTIIDNSITRDTLGPGVTINQALTQADPTATLPLIYEVVFNEPVTGFDYQDIDFAGSTASIFRTSSNLLITGSGTHYTVSFSGVTSDGQFVKMSILQNAVRDLAENPNMTSTSTDNKVTVDNVAPRVMINQAPGQGDPTRTQPLNYRVVFSEQVTGFNSSDINLSDSTADVAAANIVIKGSGTTYDVAISNIRSSGIVRATVVSNAAQDALGNLSLASTSTDNTVIINPNRGIFDFDGDRKTDIGIYRPSAGEWWYLRSSDGGNRAVQFGISSDKIVAADYTGDGKSDIAFFRPSSGEWFILRSEDSSFYSFPFGSAGDIPTPGDYDGDGKSDPAIFRPSNSTWYILNSSGGTTIRQFGVSEDTPQVGDYDGDGKADLAIFRPSNGQWWINRSSSLTTIVYSFGTNTDKLVPADYTGDGRTDVAFWRPGSGEWFVLRSEDSSFYSFPFGVSGDTPAPGDYDGDGRTDPTVFRDGTTSWYISGSTSGTRIIGFGISGDQPIPGAFVR